MRMRRILGLALAAAALVGVSAVGAVSAEAASSPGITRDECTAADGQVTSQPYAGYVCVLPDGTRQPIT
ncbi:hypothetical protein Snoj_01460 [Streptomyces nojiriensis]|uniref:Uncharacterized protein n=1 Tax=Streptomyces nojiriensis TaxID=66374 RepID=A0ABQ3SDM1_9ACTN|nr:hypothetical protein [Streptomyces nojiriensis]QTI42364.1 hypothetical protein JYK04_00121 [Streptomyces nojiriensis]GGS32669.1 hypothetical protein GCM10010205_73600 [Streptomyces nojiriensis]GHI66228.1 hypothetical protein Snoj_01460 [Streptomyces nojiriensis]